jgi:hypothetical protein
MSGGGFSSRDSSSSASTASSAARVSMASESMRPKLLESDDHGNLMHWIALQRKVRERSKAREKKKQQVD